MKSEVAFCYAWHFSMRRFSQAIRVDLSDNKNENAWIGVSAGGKHHKITTEETNDFLRKYLR